MSDMADKIRMAKAIVKVIVYPDRWRWQGVTPQFNIEEALLNMERLAPFQYPSAKQIFVIPIYFN